MRRVWRAGLLWAVMVLFPGLGRAQGDPAGQGADRARGDAPALTDRSPAAVGSKELIDQLSEEDKKQLRLAVHDVWNDPEVSDKRRAVQEATREFRDALKSAIRDQQDPQLRRVMNRILAEHYLNEIRAGRATAPNGSDAASSRPKPGGQQLLSPEERGILQTAREKAMHEPRVTVAIRQREGAVNHQQRMLAAREFRLAMREAMLATDPRIAEIIKKLEAGARARDVAPHSDR